MIHGVVSDALKDKKKHQSHQSHNQGQGHTLKAPIVPSVIVYSEIINGQGKKIDHYMYVLFTLF